MNAARAALRPALTAAKSQAQHARPRNQKLQTEVPPPKIFRNPLRSAQAIGALASQGNLDHSYYTLRAQPREFTTVFMYNVYIKACAQRGFVNRALRAYNDLKKAGLAPNRHTHSALLRCLQENAQIRPTPEKSRLTLVRALGLYEQLVRRGHEVNAFHVNTLLNVLRTCEHVSEAFRVYYAAFRTRGGFEESGLGGFLPVSGQAIPSVADEASAQGEAGASKGGVAGLEDLEETWSAGDEEALQAALGNCGNGQTTSSRPLDAIVTPLPKRLEPTVVTMTILLGACGDVGGAGGLAAARIILHEMEAAKLKPDNALVAALLRVLLAGSTTGPAAGTRLVAVLERFYGNGQLKPTLAVVQAALNACLQHTPETADRVWAVLEPRLAHPEAAAGDSRLQETRFACFAVAGSHAAAAQAWHALVRESKLAFRQLAYASRTRPKAVVGELGAAISRARVVRRTTPALLQVLGSSAGALGADEVKRVTSETLALERLEERASSRASALGHLPGSFSFGRGPRQGVPAAPAADDQARKRQPLGVRSHDSTTRAERRKSNFPSEPVTRLKS